MQAYLPCIPVVRVLLCPSGFNVVKNSKTQLEITLTSGRLLPLTQKHIDKSIRQSLPANSVRPKSFLGKKILFLDLDTSCSYSEYDDFSLFRQKFEALNKDEFCGLGVFTGRSIKAARYIYSQLRLPNPRVWITRAGSEIFYESEECSDTRWESFISDKWNRVAVEEALNA